MTRSVTALAALLLAATLSGCGLFKDKDEETKNWMREFSEILVSPPVVEILRVADSQRTP